jgi:hypothetical protein
VQITFAPVNLAFGGTNTRRDPMLAMQVVTAPLSPTEAIAISFWEDLVVQLSRDGWAVSEDQPLGVFACARKLGTHGAMAAELQDAVLAGDDGRDPETRVGELRDAMARLAAPLALEIVAFGARWYEGVQRPYQAMVVKRVQRPYQAMVVKLRRQGRRTATVRDWRVITS